MPCTDEPTNLPLNNAAEPLAAALLRLTNEGGDGNLLTCCSGAAKFKFCAARDDVDVHFEALGNRHLPPEQRLGEAEHMRMRALGFDLESAKEDASAHRDQDRNFARLQAIRTTADASDLANRVVHALLGAYHCGETDEVTLQEHLEQLATPSNPELSAALTRLALTEDECTQIAFIDALLTSELLVPIADADAAELEPLFVTIESETSEPEAAVAAFTDFGAVERSEPDGVAFSAIPARVLLGWAAERDVPAIVLNAAGPIPTCLDAENIRALAAMIGVGEPAA